MNAYNSKLKVCVYGVFEISKFTCMIDILLLMSLELNSLLQNIAKLDQQFDSTNDGGRAPDENYLMNTESPS